MRVRLIKRGIPDPFMVFCTEFEFSAEKHSYDGKCGTVKVSKPQHVCAVKKNKEGRYSYGN
jgi:hypothetical protein